MSRKVNSSVVIAALALMSIFCMGIESCSEPKEYCKYYDAKADRADCTSYCEGNNDFKGRKDRDALIRACQLGQLGYLSNVRVSGAEALLGCDRKFQESVDSARACRAGVTKEELRVSKTQKGSGTSNDRETGNNR